MIFAISTGLIEKKTAGNYGLAPKKWREQLQEIRQLPCVQGSNVPTRSKKDNH